MLRLKELLEATGGTLVNGNNAGPTVFPGLSTDSRTIAPGELFVALKGDNFDGNDFLEAACVKAAGAVVSRKPASLPSGKAIIVVPDTLKALQSIARYIRGKAGIPVIGITGSNGKTTTKEMTAAVLGSKLKILKSAGNLNNHIGLPLNLCKLAPEHEAAVLEMGASRLGDIKELCEIALPTHGVLTNVGQSHLEGFGGSMEKLLDTKLDLARAAQTVIYNADDPLLAPPIERMGGKKLISFGIRNKAHIRAAEETIEFAPSGVRFGLESSFAAMDGKVRVQLPVQGAFNVYNALAAIAAGAALGISPGDAARALESFKGAPMRYEIKQVRGFTVLSDMYNANPSSMEAAVNELARMARNARKGRAIAVLGDMLELGPCSEDAHRKLGGLLAATVDELITVGPMMDLACAEFKKSGEGKNASICADSAEAGRLLKGKLREGDTVLIKGSRGMKMERVLEMLEMTDAV
ncbi:MAG: UDP-N-acetylmuramoyl-tripeptide--D-alanyl-D-alanine ligase [Nitrospiraceae bacterium]|nr:UDP-N-acetylmuramoyl-tripeptide--D-alanyl-D-alanine ligase [Nitrospiraceae bacterium]